MTIKDQLHHERLNLRIRGIFQFLSILLCCYWSLLSSHRFSHCARSQVVSPSSASQVVTLSGEPKRSFFQCREFASSILKGTSSTSLHNSWVDLRENLHETPLIYQPKIVPSGNDCYTAIEAMALIEIVDLSSWFTFFPQGQATHGPRRKATRPANPEETPTTNLGKLTPK